MSRESRLHWSEALLLLLLPLPVPVVLLFVPAWVPPPTPGPCEALVGMRLDPSGSVLRAATVRGTFRLPEGGRAPAAEFFTAFSTLRAFCRVEGELTPTRDSRIAVEVWLPSAGWNGKYLAAGNGGYAGSIAYYRLGEYVNAGYAASSTDTGHKGTSQDASWMNGHPEQVIDFDHRAIHLTALATKTIIQRFYGSPATRSYFNSCSNGGRQGLVEATRYPADYDGIMSGAPAFSGQQGVTSVGGTHLQAFKARGGKLAIYHGGNDGPEATIDYFTRLTADMGPNATADFARFYLVPAMGHCGSGEEPNDFGQWVRPGADAQHSLLVALERWVEQGEAPRTIIATGFNEDGRVASGVRQTRPLCPFPQVARLTTPERANDWEAYVCGS